MIIDKLENISRYALMIKDCKELEQFLNTHSLKELVPGRYTPEGTGLIINVFDYETKIGSKTPWETHHSHMDIHIVIKGCEEVEWTPAQHVVQSREYVAERDVEFFTDERVGCRVLVEEGFFCLVMPEDAHKPALAPNDEQRKGRKIVVKVEVM